MIKSKKIGVSAILTIAVLGTGPANAALYDYSSVVTLCTGTCSSFASLDVGSTLNGQFEIDTMPAASFGDADIGLIDLEIFNPALPVSGPVGDPVNDNPLALNSTLGIIAPNGTSGATDALGELSSGQLSLEFLVPPFSSNGAFLVMDLSTGNGQLCLFFATAGCIPGATEAVRFEGSFTLVPEPSVVMLLGSALLGCLIRRAQRITPRRALA